MVQAVKVQNPGKLNLSQFALYALVKFRQASHTQNYQPAQIQASPKDIATLPASLTVGGVPVVVNEELEPGYVRVCTCDIEGLDD